MQLKEYEKAQKNFQELLKNFPGHKHTADARLFLGKSFLEQSNHKMAMQIFRNIAYTPDIDWYDKVESFTQMGRSELKQKNLNLAEEYFCRPIMLIDVAIERGTPIRRSCSDSF